VRDSYEWDPATLVEGVGEESLLGVEAPRVWAVAEVACTPPERRSWEDFRGRVAAEGRLWDAAGVAYTRSPQIDWLSAPTA
jgi:hexosaminidase